MAIDKLIPQYLNSDTDQKLVKSVEMTDNLNVRASTLMYVHQTMTKVLTGL